MAETIDLDLLARHLQAIRGELRDIKYNAENDRRNFRSQFDNLAATHASQLGDVEAKMAARLDRVETLLGERFAHFDERMGYLGDRVTAVETHMARNAERMEHLIVLVERLAR
jgi:hypothetical protein